MRLRAHEGEDQDVLRGAARAGRAARAAAEAPALRAHKPPRRASATLRAVPPALGGRGEGWVVLQSIIIIVVVACAVFGPRWPGGVHPWLRILGFVLEAAGAVMFIGGRITLGQSFTALPRPRDRSTLQRTGMYARARHPIYGGLLVAGVGLSLHRSPLVFVPVALLAVVFWLKSIREEAWLAERYPDYPAYRHATPRRFVPWIL